MTDKWLGDLAAAIEPNHDQAERLVMDAVTFSPYGVSDEELVAVNQMWKTMHFYAALFKLWKRGEVVVALNDDGEAAVKSKTAVLARRAAPSSMR